MNDNIRGLIQAVASNELQKAKKYALAIVNADKTQANRGFCKSMQNMLQTSSMNLMEISSDMRGLLSVEDVSVSFNPNRYYLSLREKAVADEVFGMYTTSMKLAELGITYLNSVMLHGESGTGKTLFGRYIAYELGLPFAYMNFSNVLDSYLGGTSKNIRRAFDYIENSKCVFMIDEIDAIGVRRNKQDVGEMTRIVISLLQALDCVKNGTVILGATNRLDMVDEALLRRFTLVHEVKKFSADEMFLMITKFLDDVGVVYNIKDIKAYCNNANSQAVVMNDVVRAIAKSLRQGTQFQLMHDV